MLNKENSQSVSNNKNSTINQAARDIVINGLQPCDVVQIVNTIVASKLAEYAANAQLTARERLDAFEEKLLEEVSKKVKGKINRFNEPAIQFATREAALGFVRSGDETQGEELVDLLIERIKAEEHTTEQNLIDQAIRILPTLSVKSMAILITLAYRDLFFHGDNGQYKEWLSCISPVLQELSKVKSLDVAYLQQTGCAFSVQGINAHDSFEVDLLKNEDLFFAHELKGTQYHDAIRILGLTEVENGITGFCSVDDLKKTLSVLILNVKEKTIAFKVTSTRALVDFFDKDDDKELLAKMEQITKLKTPFSMAKVRECLMELSPFWKDGFELLNKGNVVALKPTAVGYYIACRQLAKLSGRTIGIDLFYGQG